MNRLLLCTDLDRTLIPNGHQPETPGVRTMFSQLMGCDGIRLAYVSGRHRALIEQAMDDYHLPMPDFAIADVGSTIYRIEDGVWQAWQAWDDDIAGDWQGLSAFDLHQLLSDVPSLQLQEEEKQNIHKLSYYVPLAEYQSRQQDMKAAIVAQLAARDIRANLIWSVDEPEGIGLLDILPASANKLHAIRFLMQQEGFDRGHTVFSGDSGNDLDVLLSPVPSVLVANADDEVRAAVINAAPENLYVAHGGFLNMNGCYAAGILEGIAHFRPEFVSVMEALQR